LTPEQQARYQAPDHIQHILRTTKSIAVVGLSADQQKPSHFVATYMQREGYRVIPVNPRGGTILGETVYADLKSIPDQVDLVDIFRPAVEVPAIVDQSIVIGAKAVWTQLRIMHVEAAEKALAAGLAVVMDKCLMVEHERCSGNLHSAGMNTEIISAKKPS
jgi:predicted CoA-binding protein